MDDVCRIDGCDRTIQYKARQLCQVHYFRHMRTGKYELTPRVSKEEVISPNGYVRISRPGHPLAHNGYVFKHRYVAYLKYGDVLPDCELCGARLDWAICHIDHKDDDRKNNCPSNLRPLCNACNTRRTRLPEHEYDYCMGLTYKGETKTATEWAKDPRVNVKATCIRQRKKRGLSDIDALFAPKWTHKLTNTYTE